MNETTNLQQLIAVMRQSGIAFEKDVCEDGRCIMIIKHNKEKRGALFFDTEGTLTSLGVY